MAKKKGLPKRSEVDKRNTWAIENIYASDELWHKEHDKIKEMIGDILEYQGRLSKSGDLLLGFLKLKDEISMLMERVYVYANQKYHEDTANAKYQDLSNKANVLLVQLESALSFATPEILSISDDILAQYKLETEGLKEYEFYLNDILRTKPHILSAEMEELLAEVGEVAEAPSQIFSCLTMLI